MRKLALIAVVAGTALWIAAGNLVPAAVVYEGFDYTDYSNGGLNGQNGGIGFDTPWVVVSDTGATDRMFSVRDPAAEMGLVFGPLETTGSFLYRPSSAGRTDASRTLDLDNPLVSELFDDNTTMWFSLIMNYGTTDSERGASSLPAVNSTFRAIRAPTPPICRRPATVSESSSPQTRRSRPLRGTTMQPLLAHPQTP